MEKRIRENVPYQVYIRKKLRTKAVEKAKKNGVHLSSFVIMAIEKFVSRDIEISMSDLRKHNKTKQEQS